MKHSPSAPVVKIRKGLHAEKCAVSVVYFKGFERYWKAHLDGYF